VISELGMMVTPMTKKSFYRYRYLMGAMAQNLLTTTVRLMCTDEEQQNLPQIIQAWRAVRQVSNPDIEFPESFLGLSRAYLIHNQRPVIVGDFFDDQLIIEVQLKPRRKVLKVTWAPEDSVSPE